MSSFRFQLELSANFIYLSKTMWKRVTNPISGTLTKTKIKNNTDHTNWFYKLLTNIRVRIPTNSKTNLTLPFPWPNHFKLPPCFYSVRCVIIWRGTHDESGKLANVRIRSETQFACKFIEVASDKHYRGRSYRSRRLRVNSLCNITKLWHWFKAKLY